MAPSAFDGDPNEIIDETGGLVQICVFHAVGFAASGLVLAGNLF